MEEMKKKRAREDTGPVESDEVISSAEVKRLKEDFLDMEDDQDFVAPNLDLDSFMKSFQAEIGGSPQPEVVDLTSDSGDSQPELGYLLEASDDELGLPPSAAPSNDGLAELVRVASESSELGQEFWGFDGEIPSYNSFEWVETENYVAIDRLFDYSDMEFGSNGFGLRAEISPAQ